MTSSKNTKRALLASVLSVALCCAMLIGSTFAWFTDSVTNTGNRIQAGNLEIDLLMDKQDGNGYVSIAGGVGDIFNEAQIAQNSNKTLWEPGKTQIVYLGVQNKGSLALKYNILLDVTDNGLAGALEYAVLDGAQASDLAGVTDWKALKAMEGAQTGDIKAGRTTAAPNGCLDEIANGTKDETDYFALAVHMKEDADNEYQGKDITIDVTVVATQATAEEDGFGNDDYDAGAAVTEEAELIEAVKNGGTVRLWSDVELTQRLTIENDVTLDLAGKTITIDGAYETAGSDDDVTPIRVGEGGSLTITGNGTIDASNASDYVVPVSVMAADGSVTIESGTIVTDTPRESCVFAMGGSVIINGGTFINHSTEDYAYGGGAPLTLNVSNGTPGTIAVYGGTFVGRDPALGDDNRGGTFVADGYKSTEVSTGKHIVTADDATPVATANALSAAIKNAPDGGTVLVTENISKESVILSLGKSKSVTVDLGGNTITRTGTAQAGQVFNGGNLTIKNGTIKAENTGIFVQEATLKLENVNIDSEYVGVFGQGAGNTITIDGGTIRSKLFGVYQNGSNSPTVIEVRNAVIHDESGAGIYISNAVGRERQRLIVEKCIVTGPTAVEIKHTDATITNCTLTATDATKSAIENGNGSCTAGYSLAVTSNKAAENATGIVTVTGSTLNGESFVYTVAAGSAVTINGTVVTQYDTYDGE